MWYRRPFRASNPSVEVKSPVILMPEESRRALAKFLGLEVVPNQADLVIPAGLMTSEKLVHFFEFWFDSVFSMEDYRNPDKRMERYNAYDMMELFSGEISLMLDTYADEALGIGFNRNIINIYTNNKEVTKYVTEVLERNDFYRNLRSYVRTMCKYGDVLLYVIPPLEFLISRLYSSSSNIVSFSSIKSYLSSAIEETRKDKIFPYIVALKPSDWKITSSFLGKPLQYQIERIDNITNIDIKETPLRAVQMSLPDDRTAPYGMSLVEPMRVVADQLATLEALMALSRASRIERIIVRVPTTESNPSAALSELMRVRSLWKNVIFSDSSSSSSSGSGRPFNKTLSLTDMMFIPSVEGFSVETIKPSIDVSTTEDVDYFVQKLLSLTGLPKGYFMADSTTSRGSALQAQDLKFMRRLLPIQTAIINSVVKLVYVVAAYGNFDISNLKVEVSLSIPMEISEELINRYTSIFSSAKSIISDYLGTDENVPKKVLDDVLKYLGAPEDLVDILSRAAGSEVPASPSAPSDFGGFEKDFDSEDFGRSEVDFSDEFSKDKENDLGGEQGEIAKNNSNNGKASKVTPAKPSKSASRTSKSNSKSKPELTNPEEELSVPKQESLRVVSESLLDVEIIKELYKDAKSRLL